MILLIERTEPLAEPLAEPLQSRTYPSRGRLHTPGAWPLPTYPNWRCIFIDFYKFVNSFLIAGGGWSLPEARGPVHVHHGHYG